MNRTRAIRIKATQILFCAAILICSSLPEAFAQRTMRSQNHLSIESVSSIPFNTYPGVRIIYGQYLLSSMWEAGLEYCSYARTLSSGDRMSFVDVCAIGGLEKRLVATRNRAVCLYAGGGVFLGWEFYDPWHRLPEWVNTGLGKSTFLYGVYVRGELELFPLGRFAVVAIGTASANFSSPVAKIHFNAGLGLRVNL